MQGVILADCVFFGPFLPLEKSSHMCTLLSGRSVGWVPQEPSENHEGTHLAEVHFRLDSDHAKCAWRSKHRG